VAGTRNAVEPRQLDVEHVTVEKQQRLQRLVLCRGADCAFDREMRQKLLHLASAELARVPSLVEGDITPQPLQVRLLGTQRQMTRAHALARDGEQALRPVDGQLRIMHLRHAHNL